jgi:hypothetical protein
MSELARLAETMQLVRAVLEGKLDKPGGPRCTFPHCACNLPWERCEKS